MRTHEFDFFISYASEDCKFVDELVLQLSRSGAKVWQDKLILKPGDSLRRSIDEGIKKCSYIVAVFSEHYFSKPWPRREFDSLTALELHENRNILVPIWFGIEKARAVKFSPVLLDRLAITGLDPATAAASLLNVLKVPAGDNSALTSKVDSRGFYYKAEEFHVLIQGENLHWTIDWVATIQSEVDRLTSVDITFRIDNLNADSFQESIQSGDLRLAVADSPNPRALKRAFVFDEPLRFGESTTFNYRRSFQKLEPIPREDYFLSKGLLRCDSTILKIDFTHKPRYIKYRVTDRGESYAVSDEELVTSEMHYSRKIDFPKDDRAYGFYWAF